MIEIKTNSMAVKKNDGSYNTFDFIKGDKGDTGAQGSDANVTYVNVTNALGYVPVNDSNYNHTDNNYTTSEKEKLAGLSNVFYGIDTSRNLHSESLVTSSSWTATEDAYAIVLQNAATATTVTLDSVEIGKMRTNAKGYSIPFLVPMKSGQSIACNGGEHSLDIFALKY